MMERKRLDIKARIQEAKDKAKSMPTQTPLSDLKVSSDQSATEKEKQSMEEKKEERANKVLPDVWEVRPYEGVGPLKLNMSQEEVRQVLGEPSRVVNNPVTSSIIESFRPPGWEIIKVCYDDFKVVREILLLPLVASVLLEGHHVFKMRARELGKWIKEEDPEARVIGDTLVSPQKGVSVGTSPSAKPTESIAIFREGVWDWKLKSESSK